MLSGEKMIEEMTKNEDKKVKDRLLRLLLTQTAVCVAVLLFAGALRLIGGDLYSGEKSAYISNFEDKTTVAEVMKQLSSAVSPQESKPKEDTKDAVSKTQTTPEKQYAVMSEDDSSACIVDFAKVQALSSVKMAKNNMIMPLSAYRITSEYGYRVSPISGNYRLHSGVDLGAESGSDVYSVLSGTVVDSDYASDYGNYVIIDHGDGLCTLYAHCSKRLVSAGDKVSQGDTIALVGSTGASTGPHLHFEVRVNNERINPLNLLPITLTA